MPVLSSAFMSWWCGTESKAFFTSKKTAATCWTTAATWVYRLCDTLAAVGRRICTTYVDPSSLTAFVAYCLIALDKCPGVRPIGIGEVARRIIGKAIELELEPSAMRFKKPQAPFRHVLDIYQGAKRLYMPCIRCLKTLKQKVLSWLTLPMF